jgi:Kef-type K+ transport system membrane component KefB
VADRTVVETLSELGVILLMFSLWLEFSLRKLVEVGPRAGLTAIVQTSFMIWLGYLAGQAFGWSVRESVFCGAIVAISSTTIIAKAAFIAGSLIAESGAQKQVEHLIMPVRDMFAAIFFVSVGMLIDPAVIAERFGAIVALTLVVVAGKVIGVSSGAFLSGNGTRTSLQAGMSLAQIGEFSFIIASLGILRERDVLALAGSRESIASALQLLRGP